MKYMAEAADIRRLTNVLQSGLWGTSSPRFFEASDAIAAYFGSKYGLVTFSATAALETVLRAWNITCGDEVIVASWSDPADAMVTAAVGAAPVFADVCADTLTLTCETVAPYIGKNTRAVIADLPAGNPCDAKALRAFCKEKGVRFILNLGDAWGTLQNGEPIARYADAAFLDLSQGKTLDVGLAGAVVTDSKENYELFYAYHNCGRPVGAGSTLSFDSIIGGDLRVAEWQACLIPERLKVLPELIARCREQQTAVEQVIGDDFEVIDSIVGGVSSCCGTLVRVVNMAPDMAVKVLSEKGLVVQEYFPVMHGQPFFKGSYFNKLTGSDTVFEDASYPNSIQAAKTVLYVAVND